MSFKLADPSIQLLHYSQTPAPFEVERPEQHEPQHYQKPRGLWLSVPGEFDWPWWCIGESFEIERLAYARKVTLASDHNVLHLSSPRDIDKLTWEFGFDTGSAFDRMNPDWRKVALAYDGLIIAPYIWERRMHEGSRWYYGWDCASGCVWNPSAVAEIGPAVATGISVEDEDEEAA